jgi:hypothetical protein
MGPGAKRIAFQVKIIKMSIFLLFVDVLDRK